jgi:hypothetical protein
MKTTQTFKEVIKSYLDKRAENDALFTEKYANEKKNIDDCCTYILNQVQKSGCNGFADEEIYGMAVHYYDEEDIKVGNSVNCRVVVNHVVELTEDEKKAAKQEAIDKLVSEEQAKIKAQKAKKAEEKKPAIVELPSLFD